MEPGLLPRFFDRVTRQAFGDLHLDDPPAARYLADLLTRFARSDNLYAAGVVPGRPLATVAESMLAIQRAWEWGSPDFNPVHEMKLRRHIGDYTLFMTGIFRDHVERLAVTGYYEDQGRRAYRFVWETARAEGEPAAPVFQRLSERFDQYAGALTYLRKVYFGSDRLPAGAFAGDPFFRRLVTE